MAENTQLIKKDGQVGGYKDIYPKTFIQAITDRETGENLSEILSGFNMYFLNYLGTEQLTRLQVPIKLRRQGLWITYILFDNTVVVEWYGNPNTSDAAWADSSNWREGSNMLVGDLTVSSNGTWVINGVDTGVTAQGPKGKDGIDGTDGQTPQLRVTATYIQYSYDGEFWFNLIPVSSLIGPKGEDGAAATVDVGKTDTLVYGSKSYVRNSGNKTNAIFDFGVVTGPPGTQGETGSPAQLEGFYNVKPAYNASYAYKMIAVGTTTPYTLWYGDPKVSDFREMGPLSEIKASVFDGGRADTKYGGARTIDCGRANAFADTSGGGGRGGDNQP